MNKLNKHKEWLVYNDVTEQFYVKTFDHIKTDSSSFLGDEYFYKEIYEFEFSETYCVYERHECVLNEDDVVVDLGAHVGFFTNYAASKCKKVIAVEGSSEYFSCLVKNTTLEHHNVEYLHANVVSEQNSVSKPWGRCPSKFNVTLKQIFEIYNLETIDFLKVDVEGNEYSIFKELDVNILSKIKKISVESHPKQAPFLNFNEENPNACLIEYLRSKKAFGFNWHLPNNNNVQEMFYFTSK